MSAGEFWPEKGIIDNTWTLNLQDTLPSSLSGQSIPVRLGEPFWSISVDVDVPRNSLLETQWAAFFDRRDGSGVSFTANRSFRSFPITGGDSAGINVTADRAASTVTLSGLGARTGSPSDMLSFYTASQGYWVGSIKSVLSSASGTETYEVSPPPFTPNAAAPVPRRLKAIGEFRLIGQPRPTETYNSRGWRFAARQLIQPETS